MNKAFNITIFLCALLGISASVHGAEIKVGLVTNAFRPLVRSNEWNEVFAWLSNPTEKTIRLKFVYPTEYRTSGTIHFTRTVTLPPETARIIRLGQISYVRKRRNETTEGIEQPFYIVDASTGKMLIKSYLLVYPLSSHQSAIGYIDTESPPGQNHTYLKDLPEEIFGKVKLANCVQQLLPERWYGYSALRTLIISAVKPQELLDSQVQAILDWVRRGGSVIITSHSAAASTISGRLSEAAGVSVIGLHEEYYLDASSTEGNEHFRKEMITPMKMVQLYPWGAKVLWQANGLPLLTMRRYGAGTIFVLAVPIGALSGKQDQAMWKTLAKQAKLILPVQGKDFLKTAKEQLPRISGRYSPSRTTPLLLVSSQIVLFFLVGIVLLLKHRGEIAYAMLIPLSLLLAVGVFLYARTLRDAPRLSFIALATMGQQDDEAHLQQFTTYYTPETERVSISSRSASGTILPVLSTTAKIMQAAEISCNQAMKVENVRIVANSFRTFHTELPVRLPGRLMVKLHLGAEGMEGTITNQTGHDLFDALIIAGGRSYAIGDLPAGKSTRIIAGDPPLEKHTFTGRAVRTKTDLLRNALLDAMVYRPAAGRRYLKNPFLLCWSQDILMNPLDEEHREKVGSKGFSLLIRAVKLGKSPSGTKVLVPNGLLRLKIRSLGVPIWDPVKMEFIESSRKGGVLLDFGPPEGIGTLIQPRATLRIAIRAANFRARISGLASLEKGAEGKKVMIKTIDRPIGEYKITVGRLERFADERTGRYKLIVEVFPIKGSKSTPSRRWKIDSLNLTLEGISR